MPLLLCHHMQKRTRWAAVITAESSVLGCSAEATVPLPDRSLAASEVVLLRQGERHLLRDLAEGGRVLVNGALTRQAILKDGDRIQMGKILCVYLENPPQAGREVSLDTPLESWIRGRQAREDPEPGGTPGPPSEASRPEILRELFVTFAVGCLLGILGPVVIGVLLPQHREAPRGEPIRPPDARAGKALEEKKEQPSGPSADDPLRRLQKSLDSAPADPSPAQPPVAAPPPARFALGPLTDPVESSLGLFRLFLDVAGRPPTRGEARELAGAGHDERWRRARALRLPWALPARAEGTVEAGFRSLLGRPPTAEEAEEVERMVTPDRPAAFWITSLEEYRRADRRRPRGALGRAASFIVDFLDRPPESEAELSLLVRALESPGSTLEVARVLARASKSRLPRVEDESTLDWEGEFFRFFLRPPTDRERAEIPRALDGLAVADRRRWFLCVLAVKEEYESY